MRHSHLDLNAAIPLIDQVEDIGRCLQPFYAPGGGPVIFGVRESLQQAFNKWMTRIYMWHLVWIIAGIAWIVYWFNKRGLFSRFVAAASGKAEELITPRERMVGALTLLAVLLVVIVFYAITVCNYPNTNPLQAGDFRIQWSGDSDFYARVDPIEAQQDEEGLTGYKALTGLAAGFVAGPLAR